MTDAHVEIELLTLEGVRLGELVDEFSELLSTEDSDDAALARLSPVAYPDDDDAAREFAETTRDDLTTRRLADAAVVRQNLQSFRDLPTELTEAQALQVHTVMLAARDVEPWLRTLNGIRLVLASRLGIENDDDHDVDDPRFGVYDWLGYRLELLIEASDPA